MNLYPLMVREEATCILREALEHARRGWILKGRESIHHMVLDCLGRAAGQHEIVYIAPNASEGHCLYALCEAIGGGKPGSRRSAAGKVSKWNYWGYVTQNHVIRVLAEALEIAKGHEKVERDKYTAGERSKARKACRAQSAKLLEGAAEVFERGLTPEQRDRLHHVEEGSLEAALDAVRKRRMSRSRYPEPLRRDGDAPTRLAVKALYREFISEHWDQKVHQRRVDELLRFDRNGRLALEEAPSLIRHAKEYLA